MLKRIFDPYCERVCACSCRRVDPTTQKDCTHPPVAIWLPGIRLPVSTQERMDGMSAPVQLAVNVSLAQYTKTYKRMRTADADTWGILRSKVYWGEDAHVFRTEWLNPHPVQVYKY